MLIDFCLPVYNEEGIIKANTLATYNFLQSQNYPFAWQLVLIVNGSSDQTFNIAKDLSQAWPKIKVINFPQGGKGRAIKNYFAMSSADVLVYMDIDLAVDLKNLNDLINPIIKDEADLVFGSRLLKNSKTDRSYFREISSRIYNQLSRQILKHRFQDLQCGFKALKKSVFLSVQDKLLDNAWFLDTELIIFSHLGKYRLLEIPVNWQENRYQKRQSKVAVWKEAKNFFIKLLDLRKRLK
jgi:glycosyltransferase involved in cell wall biosynthesis